jgi:molecular chaperone HscA
MKARALAEVEVDADQILAATRNALAVDAALLAPDEAAQIAAAMAEVEARRGGSDHLALRAAVEALNRATAEFAGRRMDRSMAAALTGKRVDAVL